MDKTIYRERILICMFSAEPDIQESGEVTIIKNAISCLSEAFSGSFNAVMLYCSTRRLSIRGDVLELCRCLKQHDSVLKIPVLAVLDSPHRGFMIQLKHAGLNFIRVAHSWAVDDPPSLFRLLERGGNEFHIDRALEKLCPCLNYAPLDQRSELITCSAYRDRMVLGGKRLREVCETGIHQSCEYYLTYGSET